MSLDITKIREDFPILGQTINGHPLGYLDNAATSQKPTVVINAVKDYYEKINANVHRGAHTLSEQATEEYEKTRKKIQRFINANHSDEIIYTSGTTESINLVAASYGRANLQPGDEILITAFEHHSNIVPWQLICEQTGAVLKVAPINEKGEVIVEDFKKALNSKTKIAAFSHISNALGTINPVKEMTALAHEYNAVVLVDGAQALPFMQVDVQSIGCDFYTGSGHKLFAPTGIGFLYGKAELLNAMPPYKGGGEMINQVSFEKTTYAVLPYKFEAGTPNIAGAIGLGHAIDYLMNLGQEAITAYEDDLLAYATAKAEAMPGITIIGTASNKASILSLVLDGIHAHDVGTILDHQGIAVRTGHHCAMPVMKFFKVAATVRASFVFYNTKEEIDALFVGIKKVQEMFGRG